MQGLQLADMAVLLLYLAAVAAIGFWSSRRIKRSADFFMPRRFGKLMMVMFSFGAGTHSDQAVGVASKSYTSGLSGIWYQWLWLPVTPFYWLIAPVMRRFRAITTADVFEARLHRAVVRSVQGHHESCFHSLAHSAIHSYILRWFIRICLFDYFMRRIKPSWLSRRTESENAVYSLLHFQRLSTVETGIAGRTRSMPGRGPDMEPFQIIRLITALYNP